MKVKMTYELAMAAGQHTGNCSMRQAGRTCWNRDDWNAACREFNRLAKAAGWKFYT